MKAKRLFSILALILCLTLVLSSCGKAPEKDEEPTPSEEPAQDETVEPVEAEFPTELAGNYHEKNAGRGQLSLVFVDEYTGEIFIHWASSAFQSTEWDFIVKYDPERNVLVYENGTAVDIVYESEEKHTDTERYTDGHGYFEIGEDSLTWHDEKETINDASVFVRNNEEDSPLDPWLETEDLTEAVNGSGISFIPPNEGEGVPDGMHFWKYRYMDGTIMAYFESVNDQLIICKSKVMKERELAGDFNEYTHEWDISIKGLGVHCYGDGELANLMTFHVDDEYWAMTFNSGYEGYGIDAAQIQSIVMDMQ